MTARAATPVAGLDRPTMIHDMALTPTYVVLVVAPLFFDFATAARHGSALAWQPDQGARIALIPRNGDPVRWLDTDTFWLWHTANAYDESVADGSVGVVLDYARWSNPGGFLPGLPDRSLARMRLDPGAARCATRRSSTAPWGSRASMTGSSPGHTGGSQHRPPRRDIPGGQDTLAWYDTHSQRLAHWGEGARLSVGEQTFVPRPGDTDPTHGWWITIATDQIHPHQPIAGLCG